MNSFKLIRFAPLLCSLAACSNAQAPTASTTAHGNDASPVDASPLEEVGEAAQALDTQGFFQARGYFLNTDTVAGDCMVAANGGAIVPVQAPNTGGQEVIFSLSLLESSSDVHNRLSVKASASAKFLIAGGDARFEFAEETKTSETSVTLLAAVVVRNTAWTVPPGVKLSDSALNLLRGVAGGPTTAAKQARFRQRCGDGFLHSYTTGGEFFATIQVQTSSESEKQSISSKIEGHYLTFSGSAEFSSQLQKIVSNSSTIVRTYQIGGEGADTAACADVECVTKRIEGFTTAVSKKPVVFSTDVKSYRILSLPQDAVTPTDVVVTLDQMELINRERNSTRDLLARFVAVQTDPESYVVGPTTLAQVGQAISTLNGNLNILNSALKTCGRKPADCKTPTLQTVSATMPPLRPLPTKVMLRSYSRPSALAYGGGPRNSCTGNWVLMNSITTRSDAALSAFDLIPSLSGAPGGISFRRSDSTVLSANMVAPCASRIELTIPTTAVAKERATFYRVRGLNGVPGTWSFRLFHTSDAAGVGGNNRNREDNVYLSVSSSTPLAFYPLPTFGAPAAEVEAFNNNASFYLDAQ